MQIPLYAISIVTVIFIFFLYSHHGSDIKDNIRGTVIDMKTGDPVSINLTGCTSLTSIYVSSTIFSSINNAG